MHDATAGQFNDDEDVEGAEEEVVDLGEITGPDVRRVLFKNVLQVWLEEPDVS